MTVDMANVNILNLDFILQSPKEALKILMLTLEILI